MIDYMQVRSVTVKHDEKGSGNAKKQFYNFPQHQVSSSDNCCDHRTQPWANNLLTCRLEIKYLESNNSIYWTNSTPDDARYKRDDEKCHCYYNVTTELHQNKMVEHTRVNYISTM